MTKRLSGALALLTALAAIGGLIGFLSGGPSPPEAIAAAEKAASAPAPPKADAVWTAPDQEAAKKTGAGGRSLRRGRDGGVPVVPADAAAGDGPGDQRHHPQLFSPRQPDHQKDARTSTARCASSTASTRPSSRTAPCATTAAPWRRRPRRPRAARACHQEAFRPDQPERLGLKAAFHQQCTGCHQEMKKGPTDCLGCHRKNVPDHKELVKLADKPQPDGGDPGVPALPQGRGRRHAENRPLAVEGAVALHLEPQQARGARQGDIGREQFLSEHPQQRGSLHKLPRGIRMERRNLRFHAT